MTREVGEDEQLWAEGWLREPHIFAFVDRAVFRSDYGGRRRKARLDVRDGALRIDGEEIPPERYASGYVQPIPGQERARLCLLDEDHHVAVDVELRTADVATSFLQALGLPADRTAVPFTATWTAGALASYIAFVFALTSAAATHETAWIAVALALPLLVAAAALMRMSRHPFVVAPDGIVFTRLGRERLLSYASIESVEREGESTVLLELRGGEQLRFDFELASGGALPPVRLPEPRRVERGANTNEAVVELIRAHVDAREAGGRERLAERLRRGGRSVDKWLADLERLARGDYRSEAPTRKQLWRVLEDGTADAGARAAAARLLDAKHGEDRRRLRVAVDNVASPKLRIALGAMEEGDDDAQREALAELEAQI